jgi:bifunctional polynucleotide phosphatase/kinase
MSSYNTSNWNYKVGYITYIPRYRAFTKMAAFDLDDTLITTSSGKAFPTNVYDIALWHNNVKKKLTEIPKDYLIVIFTNQGGIGKHKLSYSDFMTRTGKAFRLLGLVNDDDDEEEDYDENSTERPFCLFAAVNEDMYRKPNLGMFDVLCKYHNITEGFFVGDAAGRDNDHNDTDRKFAMNITTTHFDCKFMTPDNYFLGKSERDFIVSGPNFDILRKRMSQVVDVTESAIQEIVLIVGPPGAGKSTFCKKYFPNYAYVNQDTLKTLIKCIKSCRDHVAAGRSVIIDNTNPSIATRKRYIDIALDANIEIRVVHLDTTITVAKHLAKMREIDAQKRKIMCTHLPKIAWGMYNKNYEAPDIDEGYEEIITVKFIPDADNLAFWLYTE